MSMNPGITPGRENIRTYPYPISRCHRGVFEKPGRGAIEEQGRDGQCIAIARLKAKCNAKLVAARGRRV